MWSGRIALALGVVAMLGGCTDPGQVYRDAAVGLDVVSGPDLAPAIDRPVVPPADLVATDLPGGSLSVEIGTGEDQYQPLPSGTLEVQCGNQGGHHLWTGLRLQGFDPESLMIDISTTRLDTIERIGRFWGPWTPRGGTLASTEIYGVPDFFSEPFFASGIAGVMLRIDALVKDEQGHMAMASTPPFTTTLNPACPDGPFGPALTDAGTPRGD